jgi:hypothetical protein
VGVGGIIFQEIGVESLPKALLFKKNNSPISSHKSKITPPLTGKNMQSLLTHTGLFAYKRLSNNKIHFNTYFIHHTPNGV